MSNSIMWVPTEPWWISWLIQTALDSCPWNTHRCCKPTQKAISEENNYVSCHLLSDLFLLASSSVKISVQNMRDTEQWMAKHIWECALKNNVPGSDLLEFSSRFSSVCTPARLLTLPTPLPAFFSGPNWREMNFMDGLFSSAECCDIEQV